MGSSLPRHHLAAQSPADSAAISGLVVAWLKPVLARTSNRALLVSNQSSKGPVKRSLAQTEALSKSLGIPILSDSVHLECITDCKMVSSDTTILGVGIPFFLNGTSATVTITFRRMIQAPPCPPRPPDQPVRLVPNCGLVFDSHGNFLSLTKTGDSWKISGGSAFIN